MKTKKVEVINDFQSTWNNYNLYIFSLTRMIKQQNQYDFSIYQNYIKSIDKTSSETKFHIMFHSFLCFYLKKKEFEIFDI